MFLGFIIDHDNIYKMRRGRVKLVVENVERKESRREVGATIPRPSVFLQSAVTILR